MFRILIAVIVLAPLPFGSVHPWAWSLMGCIVGILLLGWCVERAFMREPPAVRAAQVWPILVFYFAAVFWGFLQMSALLPETWSHPIWMEAAGALGTDSGGTVSIDPYETGSALVRLLTLGGIFWLGLQYGRDTRNASRALYALIVAGLVYAIYGLAVQFSGAQTILWFPKTSYQYSLTSTFVNRNSYATYAGIGLLATTAVLVRFTNANYGGDDFRLERLRRLVSGMTKYGWFLLLTWIALATALLLSGSRGGLLSTFAGLVALFAAVVASRRVSRRHTLAMAIATGFAGLTFLMFSGATVTQRITDTAIDDEGRIRAYELTMEATADSPWLGVGYGGFARTFRMYRDETIPGIYEMAHNSFLEIVLELGVPGALALFLAIQTAVIYCVVGIRRRRRDVTYPTIAFTAAVLVGVHSIVDFSLQIPAVAATFALILGIGCAQSWSSRAGREPGATVGSG